MILSPIILSWMTANTGTFEILRDNPGPQNSGFLHGSSSQFQRNQMVRPFEGFFVHIEGAKYRWLATPQRWRFVRSHDKTNDYWQLRHLLSRSKSRWKLGSMVRINGVIISPTYKWDINWGYIWLYHVISHWSQLLILTSNRTSKQVVYPSISIPSSPTRASKPKTKPPNLMGFFFFLRCPPTFPVAAMVSPEDITNP